MAGEPRYSHEDLNRTVERVMNALMEPETHEVKAELSLDALAFVAAVIFDMDPGVHAPSHLRKAAEQHGSVVFAYLKFLRDHFEKTGIHFGEQIGGEVHVTGDVPKGHTRH